MDIRKEYSAALALRLQGQTYGEIRKVFKIPKSTLSTWFSNLKINNKARKILVSKRRDGHHKLVEFNKIRTINIQKENEDIRKNYEARIYKLSNKELMILGAALYWGEGYKNFRLKRGAYPYICFGNSDPEMVRIFIAFLERILNISKNKMRCQVMIYPNLSSSRSINYWQNITKIPIENFRTQMAISRSSQGKRPWNLLPYGTFQVRVSKRQEFFKVRGLMDGIIKNV